MNMEYLKKTKIYKLAKKLLPDIEIPSRKACIYNFYRGSEWLEFSANMKHYKIYHDGSSITAYGWMYTSEDTPKSILLRRYYLSAEGEVSKVYEKKNSDSEITL